MNFIMYNTLGISRIPKIVEDSSGVGAKRVVAYGDSPNTVKNPAGAAVAEIASLTINAAPTANGNVTVTLDGVSTSVAVATTDTADGVATKIRSAAFAGWTTGGTGATVTFTATAAGPKAGTNSYSAGTTGATGTMSTTRKGAAAGANASSLAGVTWDRADNNGAVALAEYGYPEIEAAGEIAYGAEVNTADAEGRIKAVDEIDGTVVTLVGVAEEAASDAGQRIKVNIRRFGQTRTV